MPTSKQPFDWTQLLHNKTPLVDLFIGGLKEAYWSENHLRHTMSELTSAASAKDLQHILNYHLERTKIHAAKLERVFDLLDEIIETRRSSSIAGLSIEANEAIEYTCDGSATRDLAIVLVCQKIEHYEMAKYRGLIKMATSIGREDVANLLAEILDDEIEFNDVLLNQSEIAPMRAIEEG